MNIRRIQDPGPNAGTLAAVRYKEDMGNGFLRSESAIDTYARIRSEQGRELLLPLLPEDAPENSGSLCGIYKGRLRDFELLWSYKEHGYRRQFDKPCSRSVWDEDVVYTADQCVAHIKAGRWRLLSRRIPS